MKTQLIKEWNGLQPGIHDLPETMVARLKKHGYAIEPKKPEVKKVVAPKKKAKKEKVVYEDKSLKHGLEDK